MRLLVLADTHVPKRARDLPPEVWAAVSAADVVVHAGDWVEVELLDRLQDGARRLIAVYGNNDGAPIRARLPETAQATLEGVRVTVVHETGGAKGREARLDRAYPDTDLLIFGHSHIPWDSTTPGGMRLLNPGSPTDRRRQPFRTYLTAELGDGKVQAVHLHELA
ncbi:MAG TPA: YfcE family phosphodiesterase [Frankiaceae bacterium]|nr:YfcE family phosphodiesterase [Frankiaceae bacterium]